MESKKIHLQKMKYDPNIEYFQYFVEAGAMAVRRVKKADLKRIAKATGATYLTSLTNMEGNWNFISYNNYNVHLLKINVFSQVLQ